MADAAIRRRCRDEQRAMTYREAVRLGLRRPWTEKQIEAARAGLRVYELELKGASPWHSPWRGAEAVIVGLCGYTKPEVRWRNFSVERDKTRTWPRLRAWAERVLRETAELEGL